MIKIDLITGFLGSGKTTFIKKYAGWLLKQGMNIGILENDLGAVNVDMMLLHELEGERCELEMVSGGCDRECHKRRFKTKLIAMGMCGYDRVLVEPSGIFDVDEFFDVLREEPLDRWYEIGNVITILDGNLEETLPPQGEYMLATEAANAGCIVLSKCRTASDEKLAEITERLNSALKQVKCRRQFEPGEIFCKDWDLLTDEDFQYLSSGGYVTEDFEKQIYEENSGFQTLYFMNLEMTESKLENGMKQIFEDSSWGSVFRIKGFLKREDGSWLELNASKGKFSLKPSAVGQEVIIVIGTDLNEEKIREYFEKKECY